MDDAHVELPALRRQRLGFVGPHARGVDDLLGRDVEFLAGLQVGDASAGDPVAFPLQRRDAGAAGHVRAVGGRGAGEEHGVPGVVDLAVEVVDGAGHRVVAERGNDASRAAAREVPVMRYSARSRRQIPHRVVEQHAGSGVQPLPAVVRQRIDEGHRAYQVRRQLLQQQRPLAQRLGDQPEVEHLEVPQAAVDELAGAAGRTRRKVARLHQADAQAARGGVERDARANDAGAHDQDVERFGAHGIERSLAILRRQGNRTHGVSVSNPRQPDGYTQSSDRSTALAQCARASSRAFSSMFDVHRWPSAQLAASSSVFFQNPTARPAA